MYLVKLIGERGSFFTDRDPSLSNPELFNEVEVAVFGDSYTPRPGYNYTRLEDAQNALDEGSSHTARINYKAVALSERVN